MIDIALDSVSQIGRLRANDAMHCPAPYPVLSLRPKVGRAAISWRTRAPTSRTVNLRSTATPWLWR